MSIKRKHVLATDELYHVYNRGIDRRPTFTNKREYERALDLLWFYQYVAIPVRYSRYLEAVESLKQGYIAQMKESGTLVEVIAFCLMPNHFHILLRQKQENGIATYIANLNATRSVSCACTLGILRENYIRRRRCRLEARGAWRSNMCRHILRGSGNLACSEPCVIW